MKTCAPVLTVLSILICLTALVTSCGRRNTPPPPNPSCQGVACVNWTVTKADFCEQFGTPPNEAFQAMPSNGDLTLPINIFFKVIQTNAAGVVVNITAEQQWLIASGQGLTLPICQAARTGTTEIDTQTLNVTCETNRRLPNGSTSASCSGGELTNTIVKFFSGNFVREYASRRAKNLPLLNAPPLAVEGESKGMDSGKPDNKSLLMRATTTWAPAALSSGAEADCTSICDNETGICIHVSSTIVNASLLNLINNWQPGKSIDKSTAAAALGATDKCERSSSLIDAQGMVSNKGTNACGVPMDFEGQPIMLDVPHEVVGRSTIGALNRQVVFSPAKELRLELPDDLSVYGGPVLYVSEPTDKDRRVVDLRTPTSCVRIHEH